MMNYELKTNVFLSCSLCVIDSSILFYWKKTNTFCASFLYF